MMKTALTLAGLAAMAQLAFAQPVPQEPTLKEGDAVPSLQIAEWVKGQPVDSFAKDKVYVIEFWATW